MGSRTPLTVKILQSYYGNVSLLQDYLVTILDLSSIPRIENNVDGFNSYILREGDPEEYEQLVKTSWVGIAGCTDGVLGSIKVHSPLSSMAEVCGHGPASILFYSTKL